MNRSSLVIALAVLLAVVSTRWVRLNVSHSLPVGLYWLSAVPVELPRGAFVVLDVPRSIQHLWLSWVPLLKPVAGIPGDVVCHQEARLMINGTDYGPVVGTHGKPLPHLETGCQTVPVGMVLLASQAPKSLDSRYFGLTPVATVTAQATPLLTWR